MLLFYAVSKATLNFPVFCVLVSSLCSVDRSCQGYRFPIVEVETICSWRPQNVQENSSNFILKKLEAIYHHTSEAADISVHVALFY